MDGTTEERDQEGMDPRSFGLGIIVGALVGASAALLLAPASGAKTRRKLRRGAQRIYSRSGAVIGDLWVDADHGVSRLRKSTQRGIAGGLRRGRHLAEDAVQLVAKRRKAKLMGWR